MRTPALLISILALFPPGPLAAGEPTVRVLAPGFTVRALPVHLTNVNNLAFAPDGRLFALGYDGRIHLLLDADGDGLEDRAELVWDRPSIRVPVGLAWSPEGLFVASKGKVSLLRDADGDGKADKEMVVATGWERRAQHGVDALGVAVDEGRQRLLRPGHAPTSPTPTCSTRTARPATTSRASAARSSRCRPTSRSARSSPPASASRSAWRSTATATCSPPTRRGRPGCPTATRSTSCCTSSRAGTTASRRGTRSTCRTSIDEPSVFDYGPQHQSTCGLNFNEPVNGGPSFGPAAWAGDAFVTGYSRGKLYRTQAGARPPPATSRRTTCSPA